MVRPADPAGSGLWGFSLLGGAVPEVPVNFYVDGFNLYHALLRFRDPKVEWLDLAKLCHRLILPKTERIQAIKYFSAYAHWLPDSMARHQNTSRHWKQPGLSPSWAIQK